MDPSVKLIPDNKAPVQKKTLPMKGTKAKK